MKNIFKKLHIGSHHEANRSNEIPIPSPSPVSSDHRTASGNSPVSPSSSPATTTTTTITTTSDTATTAVSDVNRSDYIYAEEEEFQVQLALAISASNSEFQVDQDKRNRNDSRREAEDAAESLSRRYWDYNVLDYEEKVVDGFYDIYGPSADPKNQGKMPSLSVLQESNGNTGFEVILVSWAIDPALEELNQVAHCIRLDCLASDSSLLVQRLAELVTEHMGGPVKDSNLILSRWMEKAITLRNSRQTNILPIGSLNIGLSRHRALLFKVLADNVGIACRLVKGSHYTGIDDDAVNIIKLENEREFLVDLMAAPGTLIPADVLNLTDPSFSSYNPILSKIPSLQMTNDMWADLEHKGGKSTVPNNIPFLSNLSSKKSELIPSTSSESNGELPLSISSSSYGNSKFVVPPNESHPLSSSVIGTSSLEKGKQGGIVVGDGVKENLNVVPTSQDPVEVLKDPFADLNPFQLIGSGKSSMQNKLVDNKVTDFQRTDNVTSGPGRSPLPIVWKNRPTRNEVPRNKQSASAEGLFPHNQESKLYDVSSLGSSIFATSDRSRPEVPSANVVSTSRISFPASKNVGNKESPGSNNSNQCNGQPSDKGSSLKVQPDIMIQSSEINHQGEYHRDGEHIEKEYRKTGMAKNDRRKCTHDRFMDMNAVTRHLGSSNSVVDAGLNKVDPMLEVAEWEIPWEDLVIGERIGLGSYGEVYHADWQGTEVAVKKFLDQDFSGDALDEFRSEVRIMRRLRHPNILLFLGAVTRPPNLSIITEFLPRGSLYRILHRPNCQIDEKRRIQMALDVAKGMECLHTSMPTVVHRDLKSPNLLVDNDWNVKVSDFGLSRLKHNTFLSSKSTAGTPEWMAPEVLRNEQSNEKCDVYSFGVILWELATLRMPWTGMNQMQVVGAVGFQNRRLEIPKEVDPLVAKIIRDCWQTEPNLRPSFAQLATALKSLQRLVVPLGFDHQRSHPPQRSE